MNITVRTRSRNPGLYDRMKQFIPPGIPCIRDTGYDKWEDAAIFLHDAIEATEGLLLILDEDAFITDWRAMESLCTIVRENHYTHAGVPDGGVIQHRTHSFVHINPFFVVFNCDLLRPLKSTIGRYHIDQTVYSQEMDRLKPGWLGGNYHHDTEEPYAGIFYWLAKIGSPLFLKASTLWDGISTKVLGPNNNTICLHAWYSRSYDTDYVTMTRIDALYRAALRHSRK